MLQTAPPRAESRTRERPVGPADARRDDIQVLRAVAVVMVVLYHLQVPGFDAGFIGVDVFFVISGYLITKLLLIELCETGRIALGRFTARRIRRLLPMSFVVLIATLVLVRLRLNPLQQLDEIPVARAAATYRANFALAGRGTDYLATTEASAFQHYWSLAIEEQFYLLLPVSLIALRFVTRGRQVLRSATIVLSAVTFATLLVAIEVTDGRPPEAYFLLHARAWEFGIGGLLACTELSGRRPRTARSWRVVGVVGLIVAMVVSHRLAFPGPGAVPAVIATAAIIWAGGARTATDLSSAVWSPMRWLGDRSYSLYLWHWPAIAVFGLDTTPFSDRTGMRVGVLLGSLVASAVSYRLIEQRFRSHRALRGLGRSLALLVVLTAAGYLSVTRILVGDAVLDGPDAAPLASLADGPVGAPAVLPGNLRPSLVDARTDVPIIYDLGCHAEAAARRPGPVERCTFGGSGAGGTLVLVGDSHAAQWFDALESIAVSADARLVVVTKSACSVTGTVDTPFRSSCEAWRAEALALIGELDPDVVVAANIARRAERSEPEHWTALVEAGIADLRAAAPGAEVAFVLDTPVAGSDVPRCLLDRSPIDCAVTPDPAFDEHQREALAGVVDLVVDLHPHLCDERGCPPVMGDVLVYRDDSHLSRPLVRVLTPVMADALTAVGVESG